MRTFFRRRIPSESSSIHTEMAFLGCPSRQSTSKDLSPTGEVFLNTARCNVEYHKKVLDQVVDDLKIWAETTGASRTENPKVKDLDKDEEERLELEAIRARARRLLDDEVVVEIHPHPEVESEKKKPNNN